MGLLNKVSKKELNKTIIVRVDDELHKKIKVFCAENEIKMQACVEKILKEKFL